MHVDAKAVLLGAGLLLASVSACPPSTSSAPTATTREECAELCPDCSWLGGRVYDEVNDCWRGENVCDKPEAVPSVVVTRVDDDNNCWQFASRPPSSFRASECAPSDGYDEDEQCRIKDRDCANDCEDCVRTPTYVYDDDDDCWDIEVVCDTAMPHPDADPEPCIADDGACRRYEHQTPTSSPRCADPPTPCGGSTRFCLGG